ncbi:MAG: hypothetical protein NC102_02360, partial [Clostridium sp.]|nr:hypothetical protein [Clostridium sp.]
MKSVSKAHIRMLAAAALMALPAIAFAQDYYDDDIYHDSSKDKKPVNVAKPAVRTVYQYSGVADYPAADTYYVNTGSTRNVDEYNRHGQFLVADSVPADSASRDYFAATRRLEAFHNADIVSGSKDEELQQYYYSEPQTSVNVYVVNDPWAFPYWSNSWYWGWGGPSWSISWGWRNPWFYDPYWAWGPSWGWGPSWSWSWGWGGPGWGGPVWGGPAWGWGGNVPARPVTGIGSSGVHNPTYSGAGSRRPGGAAASRPGNMGYGSSSRPGNSGYGTVTRPGSFGNSSRPGQAGTSRPGLNSAPVNSNNGSGTHINTPSRGRNNGNSSNNNGYSSPRRSSSSSGSFGGFGSGGRSSGGG